MRRQSGDHIAAVAGCTDCAASNTNTNTTSNTNTNTAAATTTTTVTGCQPCFGYSSRLVVAASGGHTVSAATTGTSNTTAATLGTFG